MIFLRVVNSKGLVTPGTMFRDSLFWNTSLWRRTDQPCHQLPSKWPSKRGIPVSLTLTALWLGQPQPLFLPPSPKPSTMPGKHLSSEFIIQKTKIGIKSDGLKSFFLFSWGPRQENNPLMGKIIQTAPLSNYFWLVSQQAAFRAICSLEPTASNIA